MQQVPGLQAGDKSSEASKLWWRLLENDPSYEGVRDGLRKVLGSKRRIQTINALLKQHPGSLFLLEVRGIAQLDAGKFGEAIKTFNNCLSQATDFPEVKTRCGLLLARAYHGDEDYHGCIATLQQMVAERSGDSTVALYLCEVLMSRERYGEAIQICVEGVEGRFSHGGWRPFVEPLVTALHLNGEPEVTVSAWARVFQSAVDPAKLRRLSDALESVEDSEIVIDTWKAVLKASPCLLTYCRGLKMDLEPSKHPINTDETWEELLVACPSEQRFVDGYTRTLNAREPPVDSVKRRRKLLMAHPSVRVFLDALTRALDARKSRTVKISTWKKLVIAHPTDLTFRDNLRKELDANGDPSLSVRVWDGISKAHLFNPDFRAELISARLERDGKDRTCPVCKDKEMDTSMQPCGHAICGECLDNWIRTCKETRFPRTCPVCRSRFEKRVEWVTYWLVHKQ